MPSDLHGYLKAAWEETKKIFPVDREIDAIEEKVLSQHGLTGPQLEWKLGVYDHVRRLFKRNPTKRLLTKLIDAIDGVLDSLSSVCVPPVYVVLEEQAWVSRRPSLPSYFIYKLPGADFADMNLSMSGCQASSMPMFAALRLPPCLMVSATASTSLMNNTGPETTPRLPGRGRPCEEW